MGLPVGDSLSTRDNMVSVRATNVLRSADPMFIWPLVHSVHRDDALSVTVTPRS